MKFERGLAASYFMFQAAGTFENECRMIVLRQEYQSCY